jgi:L-amino acid N-acyltransferase YncA
MSFTITLASPEHMPQIWNIFHDVVKSGDTYVYPAETTESEFRALWCNPNTVTTYVALNDNQVVGTYILRPNFPGHGAHIANCSYMVTAGARSLGVGRKMAEHSIAQAQDAGYIGMQFNIVVSTNTKAVRLWQQLGFEVIGTTPKGFQHQTLGFVDTYIMYKTLV